LAGLASLMLSISICAELKQVTCQQV